MKNKFKLMMSGVGLVSALTLPGLAQASDGTITFSGTLVSSTCTVVLNGGASGTGTVTLPTVATTALANTGDTAGATHFTLDISACTAVTGLTNNTVNAFFESGAGVDPATGNLINLTSGGAGNVVVQLFPENNLATQIKPGLTDQAKAPDINLPLSGGGGGTGSGILNYVAQYYALDATTAGAYSSNVTYSLVYN
ncbi:type 1 fimbrial protein [Methylobacter sp. BlB1]|nr:type 1 fimbrial protein [Methylobacter sp. BlB1]